MTDVLTNWAGNVRFSPRQVQRPASVPELQRLVAGSSRVRALGTGHSFSPIADTPGALISVAGLPKAIDADARRQSVTVSAGLTYGELAPDLHKRGYALRNLASLAQLSVAGACATASHGSGNRIGNLATAVNRVEMVTAQGDLLTLSREDSGAEFGGAVVALGSLGIITSLGLDVVPAFDLAQYVYDDVPLDQVIASLDEIFASAYSVSLFTDWKRPVIRQVWLKKLAREQDGAQGGEHGRSRAEPRWQGGTPADGPRHPVPGLAPAATTAQLGTPGPWHERLPHFRPGFTPSAGRELQSEYLLPRERAREALEAIARISDVVATVLQICEIRTVAADELWLSPSYRRDTIALHFTWVDDASAVLAALALVERQLTPLRPRPHWGKLFVAGPDVLAGCYDRLDDFRRLMLSYDPSGKFRNDFIATSLGVQG
jgi:alditol oxidase